MAYTEYKLHIRESLLRRAEAEASARGMSLGLFVDYALEEKLGRKKRGTEEVPPIEPDDYLGQQMVVSTLDGQHYDNAIADISAFIKSECRARGISQAAIAKAVGCSSRESFSAYLNQTREARIDYLVAAMGWLGGRVVKTGFAVRVERQNTGDSAPKREAAHEAPDGGVP